jgi:hypothetical protein
MEIKTNLWEGPTNELVFSYLDESSHRRIYKQLKIERTSNEDVDDMEEEEGAKTSETPDPKMTKLCMNCHHSELKHEDNETWGRVCSSAHDWNVPHRQYCQCKGFEVLTVDKFADLLTDYAIEEALLQTFVACGHIDKERNIHKKE